MLCTGKYPRFPCSVFWGQHYADSYFKDNNMDAQAFNFSLKEGQFDLTECHENTNIAFNLTEWEAHESTG